MKSRLWWTFVATRYLEGTRTSAERALSASVAEEGIQYHWLEALGGNRKRAKDAPPSLNHGIEDEAFRNYADHMASVEFRQGVAKLLEIARWPPHRDHVRRERLSPLPPTTTQRLSRVQRLYGRAYPP